MESVLDPEQMRTADEAAVASGVPSLELMDRAAHACATVALRLLGGSYGKRIVVVCGKGNNGGDGIVCGRYLAAAGVRVAVFETTGWDAAGFEREASRADLIIDAVLGTGSSGAPRGDVAQAIAALATAGKRVLAIDIPSGVSGVDGSAPGPVVSAEVTVAIQALKVGHVVLPGALHCGRIDVAEIGIPTLSANAFLPGPRDVLGVLPETQIQTHKYKVGALAILAGSAGMTGAAVLTARGAIRAGAGLVMLGVPSSTLDVFEGAVLEAIKVPLPETEGQLEAKAVDEFSDRLDKAKALAVGPGLGRGPRAVSLVRRALEVRLPIVIDGDGLWALAEILRDEPQVLEQRQDPSVLTPHDGEYAFLMGHAPDADRLAAVRDAAAKIGAVVHLKGRRALTASPHGDVWVNTTGNQGLATGGTGDVLTGIVSSLVAQGAGPIAATWAGAYLHGLAGDLVADAKGMRSLAASDLPEALPRAISIVERSVPSRQRLRTVLPPIS